MGFFKNLFGGGDKPQQPLSPEQLFRPTRLIVGGETQAASRLGPVDPKTGKQEFITEVFQTPAEIATQRAAAAATQRQAELLAQPEAVQVQEIDEEIAALKAVQDQIISQAQQETLGTSASKLKQAGLSVSDKAISEDALIRSRFGAAANEAALSRLQTRSALRSQRLNENIERFLALAQGQTAGLQSRSQLGQAANAASQNILGLASGIDARRLQNEQLVTGRRIQGAQFPFQLAGDILGRKTGKG